jgi:hypothetical protein
MHLVEELDSMCLSCCSESKKGRFMHLRYKFLSRLSVFTAND